MSTAVSTRLTFDRATARRYAWDRFLRIVGSPRNRDKQAMNVAWQAFSTAWDDGYHQGWAEREKEEG